jgi:hypothetical protein
MDNRALLCPSCVTARYTEQRLPQFAGNPLIEALPPPMSDEQLSEALALRPPFDPQQRDWPTEERLQMLGTLSRFLVPLRRHVELARALDTMLRNGYVGREPRTAAHAKRFQTIYESQKRGVPLSKVVRHSAPQLSTSLIGPSGVGKTTFVTRLFESLPQVIYHEALNVYQITYLKVDMPSDGSSLKGLAHGLLQRIDELIPGANYYETLALRGRPGAEALMRSVARVMNMHFVGFLIADEVQNLANSHKGKQTVMTELVSACNELNVPILFIGTNKAARVLSLDFRQSRRASGHGVQAWDRLRDCADSDGVNEWRAFLAVLFAYQWVRRPVELDEQLASTLYHYSQGVIDLAIKLFASAQATAMLDGTEQISAQLIRQVYDREFKLLHPMVEALRNDDIEQLASFDDIAPVGLEGILNAVERKLKAKASAAYRVKSGDETFVPRLASALVATGFGEEESQAAATEVARADNARNLAQGAQEALKLLTAMPSSRGNGHGRARGPEPDAMTRFDGRPGDYRRALAYAAASGKSVLQQLRELHMAGPLEEVIKLV